MIKEVKKEQGRSMVEMLGVLAVVGVLSVGAISGYRYAMNKYRANQTVNELNLLAHQVAIAMMSKNGLTGTLKLGEPYDTNSKLTSAGYEFSFGCGKSGDDTECGGENAFHMTVSKVSEGVCKELLTNGTHLQYIDSVKVNEGTSCQLGSVNKVAFLFSSGDFGGEEKMSPEDEAYCNSHGKYDEKSKSCVCNGEYIGLSCQQDTTCTNGNGSWTVPDGSDFEDGQCMCSAGYTGSSCQTPVCNEHGTKDTYGKCTCTGGYSGPNCECGEGEQWNGFECVTDCSGDACEEKTCDDTHPCPSGQYCYKTGGNCSWSSDTGVDATSGVCRNADADSIKLGQYVLSTVDMNWWSAERFCSALNKNMIKVSNLDCKHTFCKSDCDAEYGHCHNKNSETAGAGDSLGNTLDAWSPTLWAIRQKVYDEAGVSYFWTGTDYGSSNSCYAYYVGLGNGRVNYFSRDCNYRALCR